MKFTEISRNFSLHEWKINYKLGSEQLHLLKLLKVKLMITEYPVNGINVSNVYRIADEHGVNCQVIGYDELNINKVIEITRMERGCHFGEFIIFIAKMTLLYMEWRIIIIIVYYAYAIERKVIYEIGD